MNEVVLIVFVTGERKFKSRHFEEAMRGEIVQVAALLGLCVEPSVKLWVCVSCKSPLVILTQQGSPTVHHFQHSRTAHSIANYLKVNYLSITISGDLVGYDVLTCHECGVRPVKNFFTEVLPKFVPSECPYCRSKQPCHYKDDPDWQPELFTDVVHDPLTLELACREYANQDASVCDLDALLLRPDDPFPIAVIETYVTRDPNRFKPFTITARFAELLRIPAFLYGKVNGVGRVCRVLDSRNRGEIVEVKTVRRLAEYLESELTVPTDGYPLERLTDRVASFVNK